jgi:hypothetical protein
MAFTDEEKQQMWNLALSSEAGRVVLFDCLKERYGELMSPSQLSELEKVLIEDFDLAVFEKLIEDIFNEE